MKHKTTIFVNGLALAMLIPTFDSLSLRSDSLNLSAPSAVYAAVHQQTSQAVSYEKVRSIRVPKVQNLLVVLISISPQSFSRESMIRLAYQLNQDFKDEKRVHAAIFDSVEAAQNYNPIGGSFYVSKRLERGEYVINRSNGCEYINYSSARGKPIRENFITIQKPAGSKRKTCPERIEF